MGFNEIEGGRAKFAYECAEEGKKIGKEYKSYVKNIPAYIKTNGLAATYAFIASKGSNAYNRIYQQTTKWLKNEPKGIFKDGLNNQDLAKFLVSLDSYKYRIATREVLALFGWIRRFADELIKDKKGGTS